MTATTHSPDTGATPERRRSPDERLSATYVPQAWSEAWNTEGTPLGEVLDLGEIGDFAEWSAGLMPGRYELTNGYGDHVGTFVCGAHKIVVYPA